MKYDKIYSIRVVLTKFLIKKKVFFGQYVITTNTIKQFSNPIKFHDAKSYSYWAQVSSRVAQKFRNGHKSLKNMNSKKCCGKKNITLIR